MMKALRTVGMAAGLALAGTGVAAVAAAPAAQAYTWTNCFQAMNGRYYCYKQCTFAEWQNGCDNGWYYWNIWNA